MKASDPRGNPAVAAGAGAYYVHRYIHGRPAPIRFCILGGGRRWCPLTDATIAYETIRAWQCDTSG